MMTCRELAEILMDFVSGELEPDCCAEIQQHLHRCPSCEAFVHTYQITIKITRQLPCCPLPSHFVQRLQQMFDELDS